MPTRMDVSDASDEEDEVPMSKSRAQQQPLTSRGEIPTETAQEQAIDENQMINEEYKIWKKNAPYLYDVVITHALDWPTLTCQWFPDREVPANSKTFSNHRLLLGTHTSGQASDYVQIASLQLPKRDGLPGEENIGKDQFDEDKGELVAPSAPHRPLNITQKINHKGEINRARYMPQNPDLIATKTTSGEVWVYDRTKHGNNPDKEGVYKPNIILSGQDHEGFGLSWNESKAGHILSSSEDTTVCYWDVQAYATQGSPLSPISVFKGHDSCVNSVSWNPYQENVFASVGDDGLLVIWDVRTGNNPVQRFQAHGGTKDSKPEVLSVAYSPAVENLLLTGGGDSTIALHDMRNVGLESAAGKASGINTANKLHTFHAHTDEVLHVVWSPHVPSVFASGSSDRRINIWDMSQIGQEQTPDDAEDGPPELLFVHGGHMARIADLDWAPNIEEKWTLVSAGEDNVLMVWSPTWRIWASEHVPMRPGELEKSAGKRWDSEEEGEEEDNDEEMGSEDEGEVDEDGAEEEPADTATPRSSVAPSEAASMRSAPKSVRDPMDED